MQGSCITVSCTTDTLAPFKTLINLPGSTRTRASEITGTDQVDPLWYQSFTPG